MADRTLLLALLRFVALVAPAVAILMQVVNDRDSGAGLSVEFELLQVALSLIILGGLIIGYQFIQTVDNTLTFAGILSIFIALPFLAIAIWWRNLPARVKPPETASPEEAFSYLAFDLFPIVLVFLLPFGLQFLLFYAVGGYLADGLEYGFIAGTKLIDGEMVLLAILSVISLKSASLAFEAEGLPPENITRSFTSVSIYFLLIVIVLAAFVFAPYAASAGVVWYFGVAASHVGFNLAHLWTILIFLIMLRMQVDEDDSESDSIPDIETQ